MPLYKLKDRHPDYRERFEGLGDIMGVDVYARKDAGAEKIGNVHTVLIDGADRVRYLVVDTGFWIFGKKVLLPIGCCVDDPECDRVYATDLSKEQVESLPEYDDEMVVDHNYEERVRSIYLVSAAGVSAPVEVSTPVEQAVKGYGAASISNKPAPVPPAVAPRPEVAAEPTSESDVYDHTPELYGINSENHRRIQLYEERLVADKRREKTGEVTVTKRIETEQATASVPVQKEKVVIEIESTAGSTQVNMPVGNCRNGEVAQMNV